MEQSQLNLGNSPLHRRSRDRTPANVINGRETALFVTPAPQVKREEAEIEGNMNSRQPEKRPAETNAGHSASKRQRTGGSASSGRGRSRQPDGGPADIINLEEDDVPDGGPPNTPAPSSAPELQRAQRDRTAASQQRTPASSVDLTSDEDVISFQILDEAPQTLTLSAAFEYIKKRMEEAYRRRSKKVLNDSLESFLEVIATAISSPKSTKAFIMTTYQKTWKGKLREAVKCSENQYNKVVKLRDEHDWEEDVNKYDKAFVKPKEKLFESAKKDFQIVEKLIDVLKGV